MSARTAVRWQRRVLRGGRLARLRAAVRVVGFWLAVALPLAYVPMVALPAAPARDPLLLVGAVAVNLLALAVGHGHEPPFGRFGRGD